MEQLEARKGVGWARRTESSEVFITPIETCGENM